MKKTVLIYSGGLDSTSLLFQLIKEGYDVTCINFQYGSKHNFQEALSAGKMAMRAGVPMHSVNLDFIGSLFKSDLLLSGDKVPHGHYAEENMKKTVVPFRNGIMLSIAAGFAASIGAEFVAAGVHSGDHTIYPDCRQPFITAMDAALAYGLWEKVNILTPFLWHTKGDIAIAGYAAGAPIFETYSCYAGGEIHCGVCGACNERKEAFALLKAVHGVPDQTKYEVQ